jgi:hypothetical protein
MPSLKPFVEVVMKEIELTQGYIALVDDEDFERVMQKKWHVTRDKEKVYAHHTYRNPENWKKMCSIRMHRFILGLTNPEVEVDHKNRNGLDCQKENLRLATDIQNAHNVRRHKDNVSGVKGVRLKNGKWEASIMCEGVRHYLGQFSGIEEAANAYKVAAVKYHGEYACVG